MTWDNVAFIARRELFRPWPEKPVPEVRHDLQMCVCVCVGVALLVEVPSAQAIVGGFTPDDEDRRFDAVAAFSLTDWFTGDPYWNNHYGNGTLIAPNLMIMARHLMPAWNGKEFDDPDYVPPSPEELSMSFRFRRKPDGSVGHVTEEEGSNHDYGSGTFHHVTVSQFILAPQDTPNPSGGTYWPDLVLAVLSEPIVHIDPMPIRFLCESEIPSGATVLVAGWGREEYEGWNGGCPCPTTCSEPVCPTFCGPRSDRLKVAEPEIVITWGYLLQWLHACSFSPLSECLCGPAEWDSGGAVLIESSACFGRLELVAVITEVADGFHFGPLEGNPEFPLPLHSPADLNHDGTVNTLDLGILLSSWSLPTGTEPGCGGAVPCYADLNCDGAVNSIDLGIMLVAWGGCTAGPGCGGSESFSSSTSMSTDSDEDQLYQWLIQASIEELFEWFESAFTPPPADGE